MKKITLILTLLLAISSCGKFDLSFPPDNQILAEDALQTPEDLQKFLNSSYDVLANTYNGNCQNLATLQADDLEAPNSHYDYLEVYNRNTIYFNGTIGNYYKQPYITIYRCNYLLESIDLIDSLSTEDETRIKAEARFIRALCHLDLVRLFAQPYGYTPDNTHNGIIIKTGTNPDPLPRNTVQEVYDFMVSELTEISEDLPVNNGNYANRASAFALLAKIHFQMDELEEALFSCNEVINKGGYTLDNDSLFLHRFRADLSSEAIFSIISISNLDNRSGVFTGNFRSDINDNPTLRASEELFDLSRVLGEEEDRRGVWFEKKNLGAENEFIGVSKFNTEYFNIPILHLTEVYLCRAETHARLGNISSAVADINRIIERAYLTGSQILNESIPLEDLLEVIERERRLELCFEGDRIHYLRRKGAFYDNSLEIRGAAWDCDGFLLQFPATEQTTVFEPNPPGGC